MGICYVYHFLKRSTVPVISSPFFFTSEDEKKITIYGVTTKNREELKYVHLKKWIIVFGTTVDFVFLGSHTYKMIYSSGVRFSYYICYTRLLGSYIYINAWLPTPSGFVHVQKACWSVSVSEREEPRISINFLEFKKKKKKKKKKKNKFVIHSEIVCGLSRISIRSQVFSQTKWKLSG